MDSSLSQKSSINSSKASQSTSSSHSGEFIFIVLDSQTYMAGDKITGEILINIQEPISTGTIELTSSGTEEVLIYDQKDLTSPLITEKNIVFQVSAPLIKSQTLQPGNYVFPFSIKIPAFCPSSFDFSGRDDKNNYIKASISYQISTCFADGIKLSDSKFFIVKNKYSLTSPQVNLQSEEEVKGCCSNQGTSKFDLSIINSQHCEIDGEISFRLMPDNKNCNAPINRVVVKVESEVSFYTKAGDFRAFKEIAVVDRATWVGRMSSTVFEKDFECKCKIIDLKSLNLTSNLTPLVKCEYFLKVFVFFDSFGMKTPVQVILPFHVNPACRLKKVLPKLPESWNPEEMPIVVALWNASSGFDVRIMV